MDRNSVEYLAYCVAEATPDLNGHSAYPPQRWRKEGDVLIVLCADGRKIYASPEDINRILIYKAAARKIAEVHVNQPASPVAEVKKKSSPSASSSKRKK